MHNEIVKPWNLIKNLAVSTVVFIILEYITGMWLNIYTGSSRNVGIVPQFQNSPVLTLHMFISLTLVIHVLVMLVLAIKHKIKNWTYLAAGSIVAILLAAHQGYQFVKYQDNLSSFLMALCFAVAFCLYVYGLIINRHQTSEE